MPRANQQNEAIALVPSHPQPFSPWREGRLSSIHVWLEVFILFSVGIFVVKLELPNETQSDFGAVNRKKQYHSKQPCNRPCAAQTRGFPPHH
jgi:hypothetical protein